MKRNRKERRDKRKEAGQNPESIRDINNKHKEQRKKHTEKTRK